VSTATTILNIRTFSSLSHRNFRIYFLGQMISVTGTWMEKAALAWLVLQLTHSAVEVGVLAVFQFGPYVLFGLFGGVISDRLENRKVLIATQLASGLCSSAIAALVLSNTVRMWEVEALALLSGVIIVFDAPARQAFVAQMVSRRDLPNAIALNSSVFNALRILGPSIGGLAIANGGLGFCFLFNAASYFAVLAGLLLMGREGLYPVARPEAPPRILRGLAEGVRYALSTTPVLLVLVMMLFIMTLSLNFNVLLPVLAQQTLRAGSAAFGALSACFGAGALTGALLSATLGRPRWRVLVGSAGTLGALELALAPQRAFFLCALILFGAGIALTLYTSTSHSMLQLSVPDHLRGRLLSIYTYVLVGVSLFGGLLTGWLTGRGGTTLAFVVAGASSVVMAMAGTGVVLGQAWPKSRYGDDTVARIVVGSATVVGPATQETNRASYVEGFAGGTQRAVTGETFEEHRVCPTSKSRRAIRLSAPARSSISA